MDKRKKNKNYSITIPVFVDSVKRHENFKMTRLIYFKIIYKKDRENWIDDLNNKEISFFLMGPYCIIFKPLGKDKRFNSTGSIKKLFHRIRNESFLIDTDHIFLPNSIFEKPPRRGDVYRLELPFFKKGFQFANELIYDDDFNIFFKEQNEEIEIKRDDEETKIFHLWEKEKISEEKKKHKDLLRESKEEYLKHYLDWKEKPKQRKG